MRFFAALVLLASLAPAEEPAEEYAAKQQADFVAAFRAKSGERFQVKLLLNEGENVEHIWANVTKIDDKSVEGTLDNKPFYLKKQMGESVSAPLARVSDWLTMRDKNIVGRRTVRIFLERQKKQRETSKTNAE